MELNLGTETRGEYLFLELMKSAVTLVGDMMLVQPGENVVITGDTSSDRRVIDAVGQAVYALGGMPVILNYPTAPNACMEPPAPIAAAVAKADVWIEFTCSYIMHSQAFQESLAQGARYICLTGMDVDMMVKTIARVDYDVLLEFGEYLKEAVQQADEVIVRSPGGTDLTGYNRGRNVRHSGQRATQKGCSVMLGGQVSWCPVESTINGTLVFDGAVWPPQELGKLDSPIAMTLEEGRVTGFRGGREASVLENWFAGFQDENLYRLAHYSLGFNPGVRAITGRIVEDERVFGCIEFGIGSQGKSIMGEFWNAASHTDGIVLNPTILLDGKVFEEDGVYQDPVAREYCRKLGVTGY